MTETEQLRQEVTGLKHALIEMCLDRLWKEWKREFAHMNWRALAIFLACFGIAATVLVPILGKLLGIGAGIWIGGAFAALYYKYGCQGTYRRMDAIEEAREKLRAYLPRSQEAQEQWKAFLAESGLDENGTLSWIFDE